MASKLKRSVGKSSERKFNLRDDMPCLLCPGEKKMKAKSWRTHCKDQHKDFIAYRMQKVR